MLCSVVFPYSVRPCSELHESIQKCVLLLRIFSIRVFLSLLLCSSSVIAMADHALVLIPAPLARLCSSRRRSSLPVQGRRLGLCQRSCISPIEMPHHSNTSPTELLSKTCALASSSLIHRPFFPLWNLTSIELKSVTSIEFFFVSCNRTSMTLRFSLYVLFTLIFFAWYMFDEMTKRSLLLNAFGSTICLFF
jgi:hypothetical protein